MGRIYRHHMVDKMTVYENVSIWIDKQGFIKTPDGKLGQYTYNIDHLNPKDKDMKGLQFVADNNKATIYLIREFIAVDADYREEHPRKVDPKDWYLLEIKPQ